MNAGLCAQNLLLFSIWLKVLGGTVVSAIASQREGPEVQSLVGPFGVEIVCSLHVPEAFG